jgi:hypothetical protein
MLVLVQRYTAVVNAETDVYHASAYGERQLDGTWHGYLGFVPIGGGRLIVTARETTQSTFEALSYWAAGINTVVYLEGALQRALAQQPEVQLERRLAEIERIEASALLQATELERAAAIARKEAALAERRREETERALAAARVDAAEADALLHEQAAERAHAEAKAAERVTKGRSRSTRTR